jgi:hypothetical protein
MPATTMRRGPCGRHWSINSAKNNAAKLYVGRFGSIRDRVEPIAGQARCSVPRTRKFPEHQRLRDANVATQMFPPSSSASESKR